MKKEGLAMEFEFIFGSKKTAIRNKYWIKIYMNKSAKEGTGHLSLEKKSERKKSKIKML